MIARLQSSLQKAFSWYQQISILFTLIAMLGFLVVISRLDRSIDLDALRQIALLATVFGLAISLIKGLKTILMLLISLISH
ncbi:MAG: hypothetical protein ACK2T7_08285, partial [Anaerolineales bacterium]